MRPRNEPDDLESLMERVGEAHLRQRLEIQVEHVTEIFGRGTTLFHIENAEWLMVALHYALKWTGLYGPARRNFHDVRVVANRVVLPHLPPQFDGYRILQLSDLHIDLLPGFEKTVARAVEGADYDLCVLTGDFRASTSGGYGGVLDGLAALAPALRPPRYAILGNHDFIEMVPPLERAGYRFLLNETVAIERGGARIWLSGVDDPHFYMTDNLLHARAAIPADGSSILLAHSPEIWRRAAAAGYDLMLCGHTHGGQICLPGGVALIRNGRCPRRMIRGAWEFKRMKGYTSAGTGGCGVPARFFCPPEATVHELRCRP